MISKVAESFALRKAFSIAGIHIEEELGALTDTQPAQEPEVVQLTELELDEIKAAVSQCNTKDDLIKLYRQNKQFRNHDVIAAIFAERANEIEPANHD